MGTAELPGAGCSGVEDSVLVLGLPFSSLFERRMRKEGNLKTAIPNGSFSSPPFKKHVLWLQAFLKVVSYVRERKTVRLHLQVWPEWSAGWRVSVA